MVFYFQFEGDELTVPQNVLQLGLDSNSKSHCLSHYIICNLY